MKKISAIKLSVALLIMASFICSQAFAQVAVTDSASTKTGIKNWLTNIKESKTVVGTMDTAKKTSAAIGTAKKAVTEYVLENKKKIEAKVAKVKEYKEKAEAYKKEYDEYKRQLDENIAKAKELKEQAESGINQAKDMANQAKDMAGAYTDKLTDKVNNVTGQDGAAAPAPTETPASQEESASAAAPSPENSETQIAPMVAARPAVTPARRPFAPVNNVVAASVGSSVSGGSLGGAVSAAPAMALTGGRAAAAPAMMLQNAPAAEKLAPEMAIQEAVASTSEGEAVEEAIATEEAPLAIADKEAVALQASEQLKRLPEEGKVNLLKLEKAVQTPEAQEELLAPALEMKKAVTPAISPAKKTLRQPFKSSALSGYGSIKNISSAAFASMSGIPDGCADSGFSRQICMYCNFGDSDKVMKKDAIDECLLKLNKDRADTTTAGPANLAYNKGKLEMAAFVIAESYKATNKMETFVDRKVAPIAEAPEGTEQDALANLVEFNKAIDEQLNGILQIYSSKLALQAYLNYGNYNFVPKEEDNENGE